jgi:hypothetical protein
MVSMSAGAAEVCDKSCVGPACAKDCVREPDATVGRDRDVTIERRREPGVEIREKETVAPALRLKEDDPALTLKSGDNVLVLLGGLVIPV